jgi:hypothetical protein
MSSASKPAPAAGRGPLVAVLAVIGVLGIIAGILYISGAANSLHFMASVHKGHHVVRGVVSFVVGVAFLVGAYYAKSRPLPGAAAAGAPGTPATGTASTGAAGTGTAGTGAAGTGAGSGAGSEAGGAGGPGGTSGNATTSGT